MTRERIGNLFRDSLIFRRWHWFRYHFDHELNGCGHPLAAGIIESILACELRMPGYAASLVGRLAAISDRENDLVDLGQLFTILAELHVISQISRWTWPAAAIFTREPTVIGSKKNPELSVQVGDKTFAYEVKAPNFWAREPRHHSGSTEIASRFGDRTTLSDLLSSEEPATWPIDNPVKDFLISAEEKFQPLSCSNAGFTGILVLCWGDFIYEPIGALEHPSCGLLTPNSFYRTPEGDPVRFPSVGGVVVLSQLNQFFDACRDIPPIDGRTGPFDFGNASAYPWKTFHQNPSAPTVPGQAIECLHAKVATPEMGAEYSPKELIMWFD